MKYLFLVKLFLVTVLCAESGIHYLPLPVDSVLTNAYRDSARVALKSGDYKKSGQYYAEAARIFQTNDNWEKYIDMVSLEADSYRRAGDFILAEETARKSIEACEKYLNGPDPRTANAYHTLGIIKDYQGMAGEASKINEKALSILQQISDKPSISVADIYNSLGVNYLNRGDNYRALERFFEALKIFQEILEADNQRIADMYLNIGAVYTALGQYSLSREYLEQELAITIKNMGENHPYVAETCTNLGSVHARMNNVDEARRYFERSLQIAEHHFGDSSPYTIDGNHNLANFYSEQGNSPKALQYFDRTLEIIEHNFGYDHVETGKIYYDIAKHYQDLNQIDRAQQYGRESLAILRKVLSDKNMLVARSYLLLAGCAKEQGNIEEALAYCQSGLIAHVREFNNSDPIENPTSIDSFDPGTYLELLDLKSDLYNLRYQDDASIEGLKLTMDVLILADQLTDAIQREQVPFEDKLSQNERTDFVYKKLVKTSYQLYATTENERYLQTAFFYADKSKAALLNQAIAEDAAQHYGDVPDSLLQLENYLKADRNYYYTRIASELGKRQADSSLLSEYRHKLFVSNRSYDSLIQALEEQYPKYFNLKYHQPQLDLKQLQANLDGKTIVEYFYTDDQLYAFVVDKYAYQAVATPIAADFTELISNMREKLSSSGPIGDILPVAQSLYKILILPIENYLKPGSRLTIVPHGILAVIPFDILIKPSSDETGAADYLLNYHAISYAFSINSMGTHSGKPGKWHSNFAGYAPSYEPAILAHSDELVSYGNLRNELSALVYTHEEVANAANFFGRSDTYSGKKATETNFKLTSDRYQILHLAMHAIVDQQNPLSSKLIFTQSDSLSSDDGYLMAREIYDLNLNADMAVLSACNTAYGKLIGGEGVMSLGRAFAYAGCPSIVMSLWPAQDQATAKLMELFYQGIAAGMPKDEALRNAKKQYLATTDDLFAHPFYWSSFIVQGNTDALENPQTGSLVLIAVVLVIFGLIFLIKRKKRRNALAPAALPAVLVGITLTLHFPVEAVTPVRDQTVDNDTLKARTLFQTAEQYRREAKYMEANRYYLDAAAIYKVTDRWEDYIDMLSSAGDCYRFAGDLQKAQETVNLAIDTFNDHFDVPDTRLAGCYHTLGIIKDYLGLYDEAIEINQRSLNIFQDQDGDPVAIGKIYNSLGVNYLHKSDHHRSLQNQLKALELYQKHLEPRDQQIANLYLNIGATYLDMDQYDLAREYFEQELAITTSNLGPDHPYVGETSSNLGVVHSNLGNFDLAEEYFLKSREIFINHFGTENPNLIEVYDNLGRLNTQSGNYEQALYYFGQCEQVIKQNPDRGNIAIARLNLHLSLNYLEMDQPLEAQSYAKKGLELFSSQLGNNNPLVARCYLSLARSAEALNGTEIALEYCQQGLISNTVDFNDTDILVNPTTLQSLNPSIYRRLLETKAGLFQRQYQENLQVDALASALETLRLADRLITEIRRERLSIEDKLHQASRTSEVYAEAVDLCFSLFEITRDRKYLEEAFNFSERSKAAVLRAAVAEETAQEFGQVPPHLLQFESMLKADRNRCQSNLLEEKSKGTGGDPTLIRKYQNELFGINRSYDSLVAALEIEYPQYYSLKYQEPSITPDQLQASIEQGTVIEFFYTDHNLYGFILTRDRFEAVVTPVSTHFADTIRQLRKIISLKGSLEELQHASKYLYYKLIAPAEGFLISSQGLTIIPHGLLSVVPFDILMDSSNSYLLEKYPVSYSFSAASIIDSNTNEHQRSFQFAGFAPSYQPDLLASASELENYGDLRDNLSNLNYTDDEINLAGSFFKSPLTFFGADATESNFKSICSNYRILHLAMHAIIDQESPLLSKLIFSNVDSTLTEDGYLHAREIYNLDLNAEMAILSACNTAYGKLIGGEGVMSLGRAFAYAGCPSIIMSLWPAQDQATAEIMGYFYQELDQGYSKDEALRNAKLQYLGHTNDLLSHPFYWANFIVQGNLQPLDRGITGSRWVLIAVVLLAVIGVAIYFRFRAKGQSSIS